MTVFTLQLQNITVLGRSILKFSDPVGVESSVVVKYIADTVFCKLYNVWSLPGCDVDAAADIKVKYQYFSRDVKLYQPLRPTIRCNRMETLPDMDGRLKCL